jgi:hypothetical protein
MQLAGISTTASTAQVLNPVLLGRSATASASAPVAAPEPAKASPTAASTSATPASTTAPARTSHAHAAPAASASSAAAAETETLVSGYSTTIAGVQYSGSVEESGGQYTASVPSLSGATATGSSIAAAENNLSSRIDEIV